MAKLSNEDIIKHLQSLTKYDINAEIGCPCCGPSIEETKSNFGDWIKERDIYNLVKLLQSNED